jgi:hypothetical protein
MKTLLISGSRSLAGNAKAADYVDRMIARAKDIGCEQLVVGDAPGIDAMAMYAATSRGLLVNIWFPENYRPRKTVEGAALTASGIGYRERDIKMLTYVSAVCPDPFLMCVWDGSSKGTQFMFDYARGRKMPCAKYNVLTGCLIKE